MNRLSIIAAFFALLFLAGQTALAQSGYDLFQKGLVKERTEGDLDGAIRLYKQIVEDHTDDRALVAKTLVQMGRCYEKLGRAEAQKAYQRVIEEYPGQKQEVAIAKERIAELSRALKKVTHKPNFRKIQIPTQPGNGVLSPDGKKLAFVSKGGIWVVPVHGKVSPDIAGEPIRLPGTEKAWHWCMSWSADGAWIAYGNPGEICIVPSSGGKVKRISVEVRGGSSVFDCRLSMSRDGRTVAYSSEVKDKMQIFTADVESGDFKQLTEDGGKQPCFSPDGKKIAFVKPKPQKKASSKSDIWVIPATGGEPIQVSNLPGRATGPVWSPDGKRIAFTRKTGGDDMSKEICIVPVPESGKPEATPTQIELPLETWRYLAGWTPDNEIGVLLSNPEHQAIYTVPASGGNATQVTPQGELFHPRWSPDGERIYFRWNGGGIASVPSEGGEISIGPLDEDSGVGVALPGAGNAVSPDGKKIVFSGVKRVFRDNKRGWEVDIYTIPIEGGEPKKLTTSPGQDRFPCWSPDGKSIAFIRYSPMNICIVPAEGGEVRQLTSESHRVLWSTIAWSPDGKLIAYFNGKNINVIPAEGGEPRVVVKVADVSAHSEVAWSPDGSKLVYSSKGSIWVVSLDGGEPEEIKTGLDAKATHISCSPDGKKIAFTALKGGDEELWLMENFLPKIEPKVKVVRQVWDYARMGGRGNMGRPSPDGRYLLYADMKSINVCALEFATKKMHFITNEKVPWTISDNPSKKPVEFHWGTSVWSPDGKKVAYSWLKFKNAFVFNDAWDQKRNLKDSFRELRTIGFDGSNTRVLYSDDDLAAVRPLDWSSDGKHILAEFIGKDNTRRLVMVSVADGSIRVLKTFDKLPRGSGLRIGDLFSPDGRHVVFDSRQKDSSKRDIHILSADGSREAVLVEHPADDFILGWTPDGKCLIFASDRTGTMSIWANRVSEGRPQGDTVLIKKDMGEIWPKGFDKNGSFYYASETRVSDVYMAEMDSETHKILSEPKRMSERFVGSAWYSDFSPDGKYLAYISYPGTAGQDFLFSNPVLCIRSLENGEEREIYPEPGYRIGGTCWSPDGRFILTVGRKEDYTGFYKIDVKTGEFTSILQFNKGEGVGAPVWSQDGIKMFYMQADLQKEIASIIMYDLASKEKKEIHRDNFKPYRGRPPLFAAELALSPDGQFLAYKTSKTILKIIPVSGGEVREVVRWNEGKIITTADWTPDGKELLFAESKFQKGHKFNLWRVSAEGGEPQELGLLMDRVYFLRIHPDGQHIAFRAGQKIKEIYAMDNFLPESAAGE